MKQYQLSFGSINFPQDNIAEILINENVEMALPMVNDYHQFLQCHLRAPFALLINKVHPYGYPYEAQKAFEIIPEISAMAVVIHRA